MTSFFLPATILGIGGALFVAPLTTTVMDAVPRERSGLASGINNTVSRAAGLIAIALLGIALSSVFFSRIEPALTGGSHVPQATRVIATQDREALLAGRVPASIVGSAQRAAVARAIAEAYHAGFQLVMACAAGLCVLAALVALVLLKPGTSIYSTVKVTADVRANSSGAKAIDAVAPGHALVPGVVERTR